MKKLLLGTSMVRTGTALMMPMDLTRGGVSTYDKRTMSLEGHRTGAASMGIYAGKMSDLPGLPSVQDVQGMDAGDALTAKKFL